MPFLKVSYLFSASVSIRNPDYLSKKRIQNEKKEDICLKNTSMTSEEDLIENVIQMLFKRPTKNPNLTFFTYRLF